MYIWIQCDVSILILFRISWCEFPPKLCQNHLCYSTRCIGNGPDSRWTLNCLLVRLFLVSWLTRNKQLYVFYSRKLWCDYYIVPRLCPLMLVTGDLLAKNQIRKQCLRRGWYSDMFIYHLLGSSPRAARLQMVHHLSSTCLKRLGQRFA